MDWTGRNGRVLAIAEKQREVRSMKERPIIFSGDNPKLILEGKKTQTRRIVKLPRAPMHLGTREVTELGCAGSFYSDMSQVPERIWKQPALWHTRNGAQVCCPYGVAGDRLYVKETHWRFGKWVRNGKTKTGRQRWRFKGQNAIEFSPITEFSYEKRVNPKRGTGEGWYKRPSIFMPRWAARLWIEITRVRVERVQDISGEDVLAEGYPLVNDYSTDGRGAERVFADLWESLHGKGSWAANPWVWVLDFVKV